MGTTRINYTAQHVLIVGANNKFCRNFNKTFLGKCAKPVGYIEKEKGYGIGMVASLGRIPYRTMYAYRLISTLNRSDYWFNEDAYTITPYYDLIKKFFPEPEQPTNFQSINYFSGATYRRKLVNAEISKIKNFSNLEKQVEDAKIDAVVSASERAYFLYDNQSLIRETFISEINKQVNLVGSISTKLNQTAKWF